MTEQQFLKSKWKPFEVMTVFVKQYNKHCECILLAVDFVEKTMRLQPIDQDTWNEDEVTIPIEVITRGTLEMKVLK